MDSQALRQLAQCPVCLEVKRDVPIYQCSNGHIICGPCKDREEVGRQCPTGRCPFDSPPRRNRQVERIIEEADFEFSCRYSSDGCDHQARRKELKEHEEAGCEYRPVKCGFINCGKVLKSRDLEKHLLQAHLSCKYGPNGCEFTGTRGHLLWHEDECVFRMVQCPDGKCEMSVKVIEVIDHIKAKHKNAVWVGGAGKDPTDSSLIIGRDIKNMLTADSNSSSSSSSSNSDSDDVDGDTFNPSSSSSQPPPVHIDVAMSVRERITSEDVPLIRSRRNAAAATANRQLSSSYGNSNSSSNSSSNIRQTPTAASGSSVNSSNGDRVLVCRWNVKDLKFQRSWGLVVHEQDDLLFFGQLQKGSDGLFYIWLQTLGSKRVASNYSCEMELTGKNTKVTHKSKVFPIDLANDEVRWDSQCFQASERLLRQCVEQQQQQQQQQQPRPRRGSLESVSGGGGGGAASLVAQAIKAQEEGQQVIHSPPSPTPTSTSSAAGGGGLVLRPPPLGSGLDGGGQVRPQGQQRAAEAGPLRPAIVERRGLGKGAAVFLSALLVMNNVEVFVALFAAAAILYSIGKYFQIQKDSFGVQL